MYISLIYPSKIYFCIKGLIKCTLSPDITFYFRFCTIKPVLSVRPLMVFNLYYFLVFKFGNIHFKTVSMKTFTNYVDPY